MLCRVTKCDKATIVNYAIALKIKSTNLSDSKSIYI